MQSNRRHESESHTYIGVCERELAFVYNSIQFTHRSMIGVGWPILFTLFFWYFALFCFVFCFSFVFIRLFYA